MVGKAELKRREEQVVEFLRSRFSSTKINPKEMSIAGKNLQLLIAEKDATKKIIFPIYSHIPNQDKTLQYAQRQAKSEGYQPAFLFYKDGKEFFRSAAQKNDFKRKYQFSLKHYNSKQVQKMILPTAEEKLVKNLKEYSQFYQPESERLDEGIVSIKFIPVTFDYSHLAPSDFNPGNKDSERLSMWIEKYETSGPLKHHNGYIVPDKVSKKD